MNSKEIQKKIVHLDCTLRDGGYYTDWYFSREFTKAYIDAMVDAGVDIVEFGLRSVKRECLSGPHRYSLESYIKSFAIDSSIRVAVMVNAKDFEDDACWESNLRSLFLESCNSSVDIVRIACEIHQAELANNLATWLIDRGYRVCMNLMKVSCREVSEIVDFGKHCAMIGAEVLYLADSTGSLRPNYVSELVEELVGHIDIPIGVHFHDNLGLAISNTLAAIKSGATWFDSTVLAMGRGPGNAATEALLMELDEKGDLNGSLESLLVFISQYMEKMKAKHQWGTSPLYYLAALKGIHPSYIQVMTNERREDIREALSIIRGLRRKDRSLFSLNNMDCSYYLSGEVNIKNNMMIDRFEDKNILLLGPGIDESVVDVDMINRLKESLNSIVIAVNLPPAPLERTVDIISCCNPLKLIGIGKEVFRLKKPIIFPKDSVVNIDLKTDGADIIQYSLFIGSTPTMNSSYCVLHRPLSLPYTLSCLVANGAKRVYLLGFSGYANDDQRQKDMEIALSMFRPLINKRQIVTLTKSCHSISELSPWSIA